MYSKNEDIKNSVKTQSKVTRVESEKKLIDLLGQGKFPPHLAVQNNPKNRAIIEAAYKKEPSSIHYADKEVINELGVEGIVQVADVLNVFSIKMPNDSEKQ